MKLSKVTFNILSVFCGVAAGYLYAIAKKKKFNKFIYGSEAGYYLLKGGIISLNLSMIITAFT